MGNITKPYGDFNNNVDVADANKVNAQINQLYTTVNGGLDFNNVPGLGDMTTVTTTAKNAAGAINELQALPVFSMSRQSLINGNFDIWQRGTSWTNPVGIFYTADRWRETFLNTGTLPVTLTHSRQVLTPGDIKNAYYHYRLQTDGAGSGFGANDSYVLQQLIENGTRNLAGLGKKVTVSFWARSGIANKKMGIRLIQNYGTGGAPSTSESIVGNKFTLTSTWTKYTVTFSTNSLVGKTFGSNNDDFLGVEFGFMWGSTYSANYNDTIPETFVGAGTIDIAQVQLNSGDQALPFQPRSFAEELQLCQRYAMAYTGTATNASVGQGFGTLGTVAAIQIPLKTQMRITPSLAATAADWQLQDGGAVFDLTAIVIDGPTSSNNVISLNCTVASGLTQFRPYRLFADGTANRLLIFDAEL